MKEDNNNKTLIGVFVSTVIGLGVLYFAARALSSGWNDGKAS